MVFQQSILAIALTAIATAADAAPQQLMNKTISVAFSVSIPARKVDGTILTTNRQTSRQIYVSSQGRLFVKVMRRVKGAAEDKEIAPGGGGGDNLRFVGDRIVGVLSLGSGASQLTISFDPSYQSCTANLIVGALSGKPIVWKGIDGNTYTSTGKPSVSTPSCSISQGNAFAS
ncbi:hypothetical protein [Bradyrhizobium sp.]|uniref:hypothetical protein n=1 Tax=Bradyrhizobium sp. TaxID=376 RepID=UPI0027352BF1|nr:hypothetical protein [Bradyrhizobium sp.]MDP3074285.1 hypothetical protein [Bradyrhizobium sp.]